MTRKLWVRAVGILAVIAAAAGVRLGLSREEAAVVREVGELVAEEIARDTSPTSLQAAQPPDSADAP